METKIMYMIPPSRPEKHRINSPHIPLSNPLLFPEARDVT